MRFNNPVMGMRVSSLKLIESLMAGRICVSTRDGARGYLGAGLPGLVAVDDAAEFAAAIETLLADEE